MSRNPVETIMGAVVLLVAGFFLAFAYSNARIRPIQGYPLTATFAKVGGLETGSDVRISGIKIGTVASQRLDPATFEAVVHLNIKSDVALPTDTVAVIASEGLLGGKYVRLDPGSAPGRLAAGGSIGRTRDYRSLEETVSEIIFLATQGQPPGQGAAP